MNDLNKALGDIQTMRRQMARTTEFRGYGPVTLAGTGVLSMLAAGAQAWWLPDPMNRIGAYLSIWIWTAAFSAALIGAEMYRRANRIHSGLADEMIHMAIEQFLPAAVAGALITIVLVRYAGHALWMLPGLWQIIFIVPFPAASYAGSGRLVPAYRIGVHRDWRRPRSLAVGNGHSVRSRAGAGRGNFVFQHAGAQR